MLLGLVGDVNHIKIILTLYKKRRHLFVEKSGIFGRVCSLTEARKLGCTFNEIFAVNAKGYLLVAGRNPFSQNTERSMIFTASYASFYPVILLEVAPFVRRRTMQL